MKLKTKVMQALCVKERKVLRRKSVVHTCGKFAVTKRLTLVYLPLTKFQTLFESYQFFH